MADIQSVQRVPLGLLELLGMKGSGQNPRTLQAELRGVVPVIQMYASVLEDSFDQQNAAAVQGNGVTETVPAEQTWILLNLSARVITVANTTQVGVNIAINSGSQLNWVGYKYVAAPSGAVLPTGSTVRTTYRPDVPIILRGGTSLRTSLDILAGGATADLLMRTTVGVLR